MLVRLCWFQPAHLQPCLSVSSCLCFEWTWNVSDPWLHAVKLEVQFPMQIFTQGIFQMCFSDFSLLPIHYTLVCNTSCAVKWSVGNFAESEMEEGTKLVGVNSSNYCWCWCTCARPSIPSIYSTGHESVLIYFESIASGFFKSARVCLLQTSVFANQLWHGISQLSDMAFFFKYEQNWRTGTMNEAGNFGGGIVFVQWPAPVLMQAPLCIMRYNISGSDCQKYVLSKSHTAF